MEELEYSQFFEDDFDFEEIDKLYTKHLNQLVEYDIKMNIIKWKLNFISCNLVGNQTCDCNSHSRCAVVRFCNHTFDFRPNCTPLSSINIMKRPRARSMIL